MPFSSPDQHREYMRRYMRERRARDAEAAKPIVATSPGKPVKPIQEAEEISPSLWFALAIAVVFLIVVVITKYF